MIVRSNPLSDSFPHPTRPRGPHRITRARPCHISASSPTFSPGVESEAHGGLAGGPVSVFAAQLYGFVFTAVLTLGIGWGAGLTDRRGARGTAAFRVVRAVPFLTAVLFVRAYAALCDVRAHCVERRARRPVGRTAGNPARIGCRAWARVLDQNGGRHDIRCARWRRLGTARTAQRCVRCWGRDCGGCGRRRARAGNCGEQHPHAGAGAGSRAQWVLGSCFAHSSATIARSLVAGHARLWGTSLVL